MRIATGLIAVAAALLLLPGPAVKLRAQEPEVPQLEPLVSVMDLMQHTIAPAADQLWTAYREPSTNEEWRAMENAAATLLAAASLCEAGGTGPMDDAWAAQPAWRAFNQSMIAAGQAALEASRNRNLDALLAAGDILLGPCEGCHRAFNPAVIEESAATDDTRR